MLYGSKYAEFSEALRVYALGELLWIPALVLKLEIDARRMQRYLLAFEILSAALIYSVGLYLIGQGRALRRRRRQRDGQRSRAGVLHAGCAASPSECRPPALTLGADVTSGQFAWARTPTPQSWSCRRASRCRRARDRRDATVPTGTTSASATVPYGTPRRPARITT